MAKAPNCFYVRMRDLQWICAYSTYEAARDSSESGETIIEVSASWEVSQKLVFRKESISEYI